MKRKTKPTRRRRWVKSLYAIVAIIAMFPFLHAHAWDWEDGEWYDGEYYGGATCNHCGETHVVVGGSFDEAFETAQGLFCDNCESCSEDVNSDCYYNNHCALCENCIDNDEYHDGWYDTYDQKICYDCWDSEADGSEIVCQFCHEMFGAGVLECDCEWGMITPHCTDCAETECSECGACLVVDGNETDFLTEGGCQDHELCIVCLRDKAGVDGEHCRECYMCDGDICSECALCEPCAEGEEHCPECQKCFGGDDIEWCKNGGYHCVECCDDNSWICENCDKCTEGAGLELCDDCKLCEECCRENSQAEGCEHGYCIDSSDYDDHLCPGCQECTMDEACDECGYCADCQSDYHCEHDLCPESSEWDDHLCPDCGRCFEEDEFCEYCGLCEDCRQHCDDHDFCPENDDDGDHFICDLCGDCYEDGDRCDDCELCTNCCADNASQAGCDHDLCVESSEFAEHWCYEDDQCLEYCNHDTDCEHENVSTAWSRNANAHWHTCADCGMTFDKAIHTEGTPVTLTAPDADKRKNGTAQVNCKVCDQKMSIIAIPYVAPPTDGKPYIITEPEDYTCKVSLEHEDGVVRWATFKVKAGGENLTYQWYEKCGSRIEKLEDGPEDCIGATTATMKVDIWGDACNQTYSYYCEVTNAHGSVTSRAATLIASHVFGYYIDNGDGTHSNQCRGEGPCEAIKSTAKHRLGEWELVKAATSTETGLLRQKCVDNCGYKSEKVIPKVEPGHVHAYNVPAYNSTQHWFTCSCGLWGSGAKEDHNFGKEEVTKEPTVKEFGEKKYTCTACGFSKTERLDKKLHNNCIFKVNPEKKPTETNHYLICNICDKKNMEPHNIERTCIQAPWGTGIGQQGIMKRFCTKCDYEETEGFLQDYYPVLIHGGVAKLFAQPGTEVSISYNEVFAKKEYGATAVFEGWTVAQEFGEKQIAWPGDGDGSRKIDLKNVEFADANSPTTTFIMPNGPVWIVAMIGECTHDKGYSKEADVKPTCTTPGRKGFYLCRTCKAVIIEGQIIEALGHKLVSAIDGTEKTPYCMLSNDTINTEMGCDPDTVCGRDGCGKIVKGKKLPRVHGKDGASLSEDQIYEYRNKVEVTCTQDGHTGDKYCNLCDTRVEKGTKIPRLGHRWSDDDWTVVREATTKVEGMEQRSCQNGCGKVETRIIGYTGPDYTLKANRLKLKFEWTYGETPAPQTINFTSIGRNKVNALAEVGAPTIGGVVTLGTDGLNLTVTPDVEGVQNKVSAGDEEDVIVYSVVTDEGKTNKFTAPLITVGFNIKKTSEKFTLTVEDGLAVQGTSRKNTLQVRGGEKIQLEPEDEWKADFLRWEIVDDVSGMVGMSRITDAANVSSAAADKGRVDAIMSPNNVTVRAVYKLNEPTLAFSETEVSANIGMPFTEPKLRTTPGSLAVRYSSSDESVATVDPATGKLTILTGGTVTITATSEANVHYESGTTSYTLTTITGVPITAENFSDGAFREDLLAQDYGTDGFLSDEEIAQIKSLDVSKRGITSLDGIEHLTALERLDCHGNKLTSIDVSMLTELEMLFCYENELTELDVTMLPKLRGLYCFTNQIPELDVTQNPLLQYFYCYNNLLAEMDVTQNPALLILDVSQNDLNTLDVSQNEKLELLACYLNSIEGSAMDALIASLATRINGEFRVIAPNVDGEKNVCTKSQVEAAKQKGWTAYYWTGTEVGEGKGEWLKYAGSDDTPTGLTAVDSGQLTVDSWYSLDGKKLNGEPTQPGIYIHNGKKVVK